MLLEPLLHPDENVKFRVSLASTVLPEDDGNPENEYDVVSTVLKSDGSVEVWIWGATTQEGSGTKRARDMQQIQKLKDKIGQRWSGEVRTPAWLRVC